MKLRFEGQTIRIRLSDEEIETFRAGNLLKHCIGPGDDPFLCYSLIKDPKYGFGLTLEGREIKITMPAEQALLWLNSNRIGIEETLDMGDGKIRVIVEKDLKPKKERFR